MFEMLNRYYLFTKEYIKSKGFFILTILMFFCVILSHAINNQYSDDRFVAGICVTNTNVFNNNIEKLLIEKGSFVSYEDMNRLNKDVTAGVICCGFVLDGNISDYDYKNGKGYSIHYLTSNSFLESESFKEQVYECFLKLYNDVLISQIAGDIFDNTNEELVQNVIEKKNDYLSSDSLFKIDLMGKTSMVNNENGKNLVRGLIAICVFLAVLLRGYSLFDEQIDSIIKIVSINMNQIYRFLYLISAGISVGVIGYILQIFENGFSSFIADALKMLMLIIYSAVWTLAAKCVIKNRKLYYQAIVLTLPLMLIICPIIFETGIYIKAFNVLKYIFPISLYI